MHSGIRGVGRAENWMLGFWKKKSNNKEFIRNKNQQVLKFNQWKWIVLEQIGNVK